MMDFGSWAQNKRNVGTDHQIGTSHRSEVKNKSVDLLKMKLWFVAHQRQREVGQTRPGGHRTTSLLIACTSVCEVTQRNSQESSVSSFCSPESWFSPATRRPLRAICTPHAASLRPPCAKQCPLCRQKHTRVDPVNRESTKKFKENRR